MLTYEKKYWNKGLKLVAGIDEAGRGPLAGPVVAASVIFDENIADWEPYALEVLATVLGGYEGARLDASIVRRKKLATTTSISYSLATLLPDLLTISAIPREGISLEKLESALKKEISVLLQNPPSAKELEKVIAQTIAESVFQRDSIAYQAILIGSLDSVGLDWRLKDTYLQNIKNVTAEQVRFVTGKYLKPKSLTIISLIPKDLFVTVVHSRELRSFGMNRPHVAKDPENRAPAVQSI